MWSLLVVGCLFLLAIYMAGMHHPFLPAHSPLNFSIVSYAVGIVAAIAAWFLLWRGLDEPAPDPNGLVAILAPMAAGALVASWRLWAKREVVGVYAIGLTPFLAIASWLSKAGSSDDAAIALLVPAAALIGGSSWYVAGWAHPMAQVGAMDLSTLTGSSAPLFESMLGLDPQQTKRLLANREVLARMAVFLQRKHSGVLLYAGIPTAAAAILSWVLPSMAPAYGWLGVIAAPVGVIPLVVLLIYARRVDFRTLRKALLGPHAALYQAMGAVVPMVFVSGQLAWAWRYFRA